jgi:hypothetical protein
MHNDAFGRFGTFVDTSHLSPKTFDVFLSSTKSCN